MATYPAETVSGVVTSWLPLSTGSPPPSGCSWAIYSQQGSSGQFIAFDPFYQRVVDPSFTSACFPEEATLWWNQKNAKTVTSLGPFECPGGYSTAFTTEVSSRTNIACCPSGYKYQGSMLDHATIGECVSTPAAGNSLNYFTSTGGDAWFQTSTILGSTHIAGVQINGWNFVASETASSKSSSTTSSSSPSDTAPAQPGASSNPATSEPTSPSLSNAGAANSSGLSTGSKAALGVGIALAVIGIVALAIAFFLFRRQRQLKKQNALAAPLAIAAPAYGGDFYAGQVREHKEVDGTNMSSELMSPTGPTGPYEMNGQYRQEPQV